MRFRSTGLGKTELQAEAIKLEPVGDLLILHVRTTSPVRWQIRAGVQRSDLFTLIRLALNPKVIKYLLGSFKRGNLNEPKDF